MGRFGVERWMTPLQTVAVILGAGSLLVGVGELIWQFASSRDPYAPIRLVDWIVPPARIALGLVLIVWGAKGRKDEPEA